MRTGPIGTTAITELGAIPITVTIPTTPTIPLTQTIPTIRPTRAIPTDLITAGFPGPHPPHTRPILLRRDPNRLPGPKRPQLPADQVPTSGMENGTTLAL